MDPALMVRAVRMVVVPCDRGRRWHVIGGTDPHIVERSALNPKFLRCDCRAAGFGHECAHRVAVSHYIGKMQKGQ